MGYITDGSNEDPAVMSLCSEAARITRGVAASLTEKVTDYAVIYEAETDVSQNEVKNVATAACAKVEENSATIAEVMVGSKDDFSTFPKLGKRTKFQEIIVIKNDCNEIDDVPDEEGASLRSPEDE